MNKVLKNILSNLRMGNLSEAYSNKQYLNDIGLLIYNKPELNKDDIEDLKDIILIGNITYNDTDRELLPLDDGFYDLLLEKYKRYDSSFQVGAEVIDFKTSDHKIDVPVVMKPGMVEISSEDQDRIVNGMYCDELNPWNIRINKYDFDKVYYNQNYPVDPNYIPKRKHDTSHNHPELVGTLDKCKFVLSKDALDRGVYKDSNVKIVERDFFFDHIQRGIIRPDEEFDIILELKYDGISIEADCTDEIISARSRGDTGIGKASDYTPILKGYKFPHRHDDMREIGVKFEAIITEYDLPLFNKAKGYEYKNCRSAIVGLFASSDAYKYRDFITLVPLAVENSVFVDQCNSDRIKEIEYLNEHFINNNVPLIWSYYRGNYINNLFMIKTFLDEAEFLRKYYKFMYDGIVLSYRDPDKRAILGRENFVNKYSIAVKFNPMTRQTIFRGYTFTVGQDGSITPMIHYDPVEFYGTIHPKSSGHSYKRFEELKLRKGDMINVEYVNDVMPYVSKPDNDWNRNNADKQPLEEFPVNCPICGTPLIISDSGRSVKCPNTKCGGRSLARMVNMCAKLNMNGFGEATLATINVDHLEELFLMLHRSGETNYDNDHDKILSDMGFGPVEISNMRDEVDNLLSRPLLDSEMMGAIGFTGIATKTWELILSKFTIQMIDDFIVNQGWDIFNYEMGLIKGIGPTTTETIFNEWNYFRDDIIYMMNNANIIHYQPVSGKKIRATGFRDKQLFEYLRSLGFDADDNGSLTKDTDILLVPQEGFTSSKTQKATQYGVQIIPVNDFDPNKFM